MKYPVATPSISELEKEYVAEAVNSGWISSLGPFIDKFEKKLAEQNGVSNSVAISNGTVGLHLILHALGVGPGDEVIVPALSFVASVNAILYCGATPVFVDVLELNYGIDPESLKRAITPRTKAVVAVHLYGVPCSIIEIQSICHFNDLFLIEDAAESIGAEVNGQKVGTFGIAGMFSFYANKLLTTGEGGGILTNSQELTERMKHLRDHAMSKKTRYYHDELGFNYRMTNIQAALGFAQLERFDSIWKLRKAIFNKYNAELLDLNMASEKMGQENNSPWLYVFENEKLVNNRQEIQNKLRLHGIDTRPMFVPLDQLPYLTKYSIMNTPNANKISSRGLNLPTYIELTENDISFISGVLKKLL